jgi:multidrug efflux pump subunit AcrA (membrane-fusion protein)
MEGLSMMIKKTKPNFSTVLTVLLPVLLSVCFGSSAFASDSPTYKVKTGSFSQTTVLTGNLKAKEFETLLAPLTENYRVQIKWMAKEGEYVKPGDPVVRFDSGSVSSTLENMELSLREKEDSIKQKLAAYANQELELNLKVKQAEIAFRQRELTASIPKDIIPAYQYEQNQMELKKGDEFLKSAKIEKEVTLAGLKLEIKRLNLELDEIKTKLEKTQETIQNLTLNAQTAGPLIYYTNSWTGRKIQVGDNVYATQTVATISNNNSLQVEAWLDETHIHRVKIGQKVDILPDAYPGKQFTGIIKDIMKTAEKVPNRGKARYFNIIISLDSLDFSIMKPGMSVKCTVHTANIPVCLTVPLEMTYFDGQSFWVKPAKKKAVKVDTIGFNEFVLALPPGTRGPVKEGTILQQIDSSNIKDIKE